MIVESLLLSLNLSRNFIFSYSVLFCSRSNSCSALRYPMSVLHNTQHILEFITELHLLLHLQSPFFAQPSYVENIEERNTLKLHRLEDICNFLRVDVVIFLVPVHIILISHCFNLDIVSGPWKSLKKVRRFRDFGSSWMSPLLSHWNVIQMNDFKTNSRFFFFLKASFF